MIGIDTYVKGWNAFMSRDPTNSIDYTKLGSPSTFRPTRTTSFRGSENSIVSSIYSRIAMDVAAVKLRHVRVDEDGNFVDEIKSGLNYALTTEANIDQSSTAFIMDIVISMFDEGVVAVVPVDTTLNPIITGGYDVQTMRTGRIKEWFPRHVTVETYNDRTANRELVTLPKSIVAIIENPLYSVMNEPNSTLKRLINKLTLLDAIDNQSGSGRLDLIVQLPYTIKSKARMERAEERRTDLERQLKNSKYGVAYLDATEKVTQLNRPAENNLLNQIQYLTSMLYSQLGITEEVFNGTASEEIMLNYKTRSITPLVKIIAEEMDRAFITKTARRQKQAIRHFTDPFALMTGENLAQLADKLTRNEILSSNEIRSVLGYRPSKDPKADELRNKNLNQKNQEPPIKEKGAVNNEE